MTPRHTSISTASLLTMLGCVALGFATAWAPRADAASSAGAAPVHRARSAHAAPRDIVIDGRNVYPESLSAAPDGTLYIGSMMGAVYRALPGRGKAEPWIRANAANGLQAVFGVLADAPSRTLWVCTSPTPLRPGGAHGVTALMAFNLRTASLEGAYPFPPPRSTCNDIAVARDGTVYATDTPNGRILELPRGGHALRVFAVSAQLKGIDGITFSGSGVMYADLVGRNTLIRIDRNPDGSVGAITRLAASRPLGGPDGLRPIAGNRFLLAEGTAGRIDEVAIDGDRAEVTVLRSGFQASAGVTLAGRTAYAVDGKIGYLIDPHLKGKDPGTFAAYAIALPR